jgi:drug/metabolite transporter (DMT)-like permease
MLFRETSPFLKPGEQTWEPVVEGFTAYFVLGEVLFPLQVLGGTGIIAAIALLQMAREKCALPTPIEIRQKV